MRRRPERSSLSPHTPRNAPAPKDAQPSALRYGVALWALASVHRWLFILAGEDRSWPFSVFYEGDAEPFHLMARAMLRGATYDNGIPYHPPGFAFLLAGIHAIVGAGGATEKVPYLAVKLVLAALSAGAVPLLYLLIRRFLGHGTALVGALLATYSFALLVLASAPVAEGPFQVLLLLWLLTVTGLRGGPVTPETAPPVGGRKVLFAGFASGVLVGAGCLVRAELQLLAATVLLLGTVHAWRRRGPRAALPWLFMALGATAAVAPWTMRNSMEIREHNRRNASIYPRPLGTFVPVTAYGPINFALANNPEADGRFSRRALQSRAREGVLDLRDPEHYRYFTEGTSIGLRWIREEPDAFLRLVLRKWALFFGVLRAGFLQRDWPGGLAGVRQPVDMFVPEGAGALPVLALLLAGGFVLAIVDGGAPRRLALLVAIVTACWLVSSGLFFGYARLGAVVLPLWLGLAAHALVRGVLRFVPRASAALADARTAVQLTAVVAAAFLLLEVALTVQGRKLQATGTTLPGQTHINPHDVVHLSPMP